MEKKTGKMGLKLKSPSRSINEMRKTCTTTSLGHFPRLAIISGEAKGERTITQIFFFLL